MPTKERSEELFRAALDIVTPDVQAELDGLVDTELDARRVELRRLAQQLQTATGCYPQAARNHIAKALRARRGERVVPDERGGSRPGAGAPTGNQNWRGRSEE